MPNQNDIRQAITDSIISALESGNVPPWRRPWRLGKNAGAHANVVTKRSYRGNGGAPSSNGRLWAGK
jgi:antirestriction protein ArdC